MRTAACVILALTAGATGCGPAEDTRPNPDLKVPDVPPGRGAEKGGAAKEVPRDKPGKK